MAGVKKWTIIRQSGNTEVLCGPGSSGSTQYRYIGVLDWCYRDLQGGGSQYDRPNMLLADGVVILEKGLSDLAYKYGTDLRDAYDAARKMVEDKHKYLKDIDNGQV